MDVRYPEQLSRLTTFFRYLLAIPHLFLLGVWGYLVELVSVIQWFIILFTGKRNRGIWGLQRGWMAYGSRVNAYVYLTHDRWPAFGSDWGDEPVAFAHGYVEPADRLTNGLRLIWAIPAMLIGWVLSLGLFFVMIAAWFAILFTGRFPRGMFDYTVRVLRYSLNLTAYAALMTDVYPKWGGDGVVGALPPGDLGDGATPTRPPTGAGQPLPPPSGPAYP